jgi:hypothetical protein
MSLINSQGEKELAYNKSLKARSHSFAGHPQTAHASHYARRCVCPLALRYTSSNRELSK